MNALQFLLDYSNASEYEDKRDETTNTWLFFANAMEEYHKHKVNNGVLDDVSQRSELFEIIADRLEDELPFELETIKRETLIKIISNCA
jgi:hypothetical protein